MAGTKEGGTNAMATNKQRYGESFPAKIGAVGGALSRGGGFTGDPDRAAYWGKIGGSISRRYKIEASEPRTVDCRYCNATDHTIRECDLKTRDIARKRAEKARKQYLDELDRDDRNKMSALARKWSNR